MRPILFLSVFSAVCASSSIVGAQSKVSFQRQVLPVLKKSCYRCHQGTFKDANGRTRRPKGGLRLDGRNWILRGGKHGAAVVPGKPTLSPLFNRVVLDPDDDDIMPQKGDPLTKPQTELIRRWVAEGADFGSWKGKAGPAPAEVARAQAEASPHKLTSSMLDTIDRLGKGVRPALPQAVKRAAGTKCQVEPVAPGSPLLRVTFVSNESSVGGRDLANLEPLAAHITYLGLGKTRVGDGALSSVGRMQNLTRLDLNRTAISDTGLARLSSLSELRSLNLHSTNITDAGLQAIAQLVRLERLYLWNTKVTPDGVRKLRRALPRTKISYELELPAVDPRSANTRRRRR